MRILAVTLSGVLCALMLHHATGASTGRTAGQDVILSSLKQLHGQVIGNSTHRVLFGGPLLPQMRKAHSSSNAATYHCYTCVSQKVNGKWTVGSASCDDPFPGGQTESCPSATGDYCGKAKETVSAGGSTVHTIIRGCLPARTGIDSCKDGESSISGKFVVQGITTNIDSVQACCDSDTCNGTPSVNYNSKICVTFISILLAICNAY